MSRSPTAAKAYEEAEVEITGAHQRFLYGFGAQLEVLSTLLEKQHWQAAADIMPHIAREKNSYEGLLMEIAGKFTARGVAASQCEADALQSGESEGEPVHSEIADFGEVRDLHAPQNKV